MQTLAFTVMYRCTVSSKHNSPHPVAAPTDHRQWVRRRPLVDPANVLMRGCCAAAIHRLHFHDLVTTGARPLRILSLPRSCSDRWADTKVRAAKTPGADQQKRCRHPPLYDTPPGARQTGNRCKAGPIDRRVADSVEADRNASSWRERRCEREGGGRPFRTTPRCWNARVLPCAQLQIPINRTARRGPGTTFGQHENQGGLQSVFSQGDIR